MTVVCKIINWLTKLANPLIWILVLLLLFLLTLQKCNNVKLAKDYAQYTQVGDSLLQVMEKAYEKDGKVYSQYRLLAIEYEDFKNMKSKEVLELKAKLKAAGIKEKDLKTAVTFNASVRDTIQIAVVDTAYVDTSGNKQTQFAYSDSFMHLSGTVYSVVDSNKADSINNVAIRYNLEEKYTIVHAFKKSGLFKPKTLSLTIVSDNPNVVVGKVQTYTIQAPKPKFYEKWWFSGLIGAGLGSALTMTAVHYSK